jgi:hypothetical protein
VAGDRRPPSWLAWVLCCISLALLVAGAGLRVAFPETFDDGALYVLVGTVGFALVPLVGALIAARLPANPYGWLWCGLGLLYGIVTLTEGLRRAGAVSGPIEWVVLGPSFAVILCLLVFVLLLFPTGRLPGRSWRWPAQAAVIVAGSNLLMAPFAPSFGSDVAPTPWAVGGRAGDVLVGLLEAGVRVMFALILLAAVSVLVRFRRAGPVERQQLKWFLLAAGVAAVTLVVDQIGVAVSSRVWAVVDALSFALLPASVGIAVLRYRLYEIDRILSRTVSYGLLSAALIGLYLLLVALLRPLLEPLTGSSALAVAGSTLAVAAVFSPARLRNHVDLDEVTAGLRDTVAATVAPARVSVWLRVQNDRTGSEP